MFFNSDFFSLFRRNSPEQHPWWIEVKTHQPACTYYFGPYGQKREAIAHQQGFLEDLRSEHAVGIDMAITRIQPDQLTVFHDDPSR